MKEKNTYEIFCEDIMERIREKFEDDYIIDNHEVIKNNSLKLDGISIHRSNDAISPNFYLQDLYKFYNQGMDIDDIVSDLVERYYRAVNESKGMNIDFSFNYCRDIIVARLVSNHMNEGILKNIPYIPFLDMAIVFYVVIKQDDEGIGSVRVNNYLFEKWDIGMEELLALAVKNTEKIFPTKICRMSEMLKELLNEQEYSSLNIDMNNSYERTEPLIITNEQGINGAVSLVLDGTTKKVAEILKGNYYLLPSSIHEFLAISDNDNYNKEDLHNMVNEVNNTCVVQEELLSDSIYYYDNESDNILKIVS